MDKKTEKAMVAAYTQARQLADEMGQRAEGKESPVVVYALGIILAMITKQTSNDLPTLIKMIYGAAQIELDELNRLFSDSESADKTLN